MRPNHIIGAGLFSAGASVGLKINTTEVDIDQTITIDGVEIVVRFSATEVADASGPYFVFSLSDFSLNIGNFVVIEGENISIGSSGSFLGTGLSVFMGKGPAKVETTEGSGIWEISSTARGFLIDNADVGFVKTGDGLFAFYARGEVMLLGVPGVSISSQATVRFNNTGANRNVDISASKL